MPTDDAKLFDVGRPRVRATKAEVLRDIRAFASLAAGQKVTATGFKNWDGKVHSLDTVVRLFGGFANACEEAGVPYKKKAQYSDQELVEHFETVWRWRGQKLVRSDLLDFNKENGTNVHPDTYAKRWGWTVFVNLFAKYKLGQISFNELVEAKRRATVRQPISPRLRATILNRDNYRCADCGKSTKDDADLKLEVHHIIPVSKGGLTEPTNLITNCKTCNAGKSDVVLN